MRSRSRKVKEVKMEKKRGYDGLSELDEKTQEMVEAIRRGENIEIRGVKQEREVIRIMGREIIRITGKNEFGEEEEFIILPEGDEEGEEIARERLADGEMWRSVVNGGGTTKGLDKWIDSVIEIDGWGGELSHYDGAERYVKTDVGKKVVYYRSN